MNEFLIKLRALFTGSGFTDAEAGLKRVKAAADEAAKATTKATTAPSAGSAPGSGKMFTAQESKDLARSIMAEATQKAEEAEKALRRVEDQAGQTQAALQGDGGQGGGGSSFLERLPRIGALALGAIGVGKLAAAQFEKLSAGVKATAESLREFSKSYTEAANAGTLDGAISGFENLNSLAEATRDRVKELRQDWGAWTANLLMGGAAFREMTAAAEAQRFGAYSALVGATSRQAGTAEAIAADPTDTGRVDAILRANKRADEMAKLQQAIEGAKSGNERISAQNAIDFTKQRYAAEDEALAKINAVKQEGLRLELEIQRAKQDGNQVEVDRLQWVKAYTAALEKAKAAGMADPYGFARDSANAAMPDKAAEFADFQRAMEKARQEGLDREYEIEEEARQKRVAAERKAAKEAADARVDEAQRAVRASDMDLEGRMAGSRPGAQQRQLQWLRDYKSALRDLTDGLAPGTAAWDAAARKAGEIADNLSKAASNQDKLNASASAQSGDFTRGSAGRIAAERSRAEERAQRYEQMGAYSLAERIRKTAEQRAEAQAAKALSGVEADKFKRGQSPVERPDASTIKNAQAEAAMVAAAKLEAAAASLTAAAGDLANVGRYQ